MHVESIALNTFFGVELLTEMPADAAHHVCATAAEVGTLFRRLEVMDILEVGGRRFVRCRSDLVNPYPMLDRVFALGRSVIVQRPGGYIARFQDGRTGPVTQMTMHSTPKVGQRATFKGPKVRYWERQFE